MHGNKRRESLLLGRVEDLVVEHREVEGKPQPDGVSGSQIHVGNLGGGLVGLERLLGSLLPVRAGLELGQVAVVVTLPATPKSARETQTGG